MKKKDCLKWLYMLSFQCGNTTIARTLATVGTGVEDQIVFATTRPTPIMIPTPAAGERGALGRRKSIIIAIYIRMKKWSRRLGRRRTAI